MQISEIIPATLLVRCTMKLHGKRAFNNKYKSCRTVKCYLPSNHMEEVELCGDIRTVLAKAGYNSYSITTTKGTKWGAPGLIVRLPL